jgi:sec-independent protein translocase protein TatA
VGLQNSIIVTARHDMFTVRAPTARAAPARAMTQRSMNERATLRRPLAAPARRRARVVSNGLFGLGLPEIVVIGGVAAVLFGPQKIPELGKSLGKTVKSFQEAAKVREDEANANASVT